MEDHHEMIRSAWGSMEYATELDRKPMRKDRDKIRGSLIGGAAGDALGYAVEFWPESRIFSYYGKDGITQYRLVNGVAQISDDTQMTLFTANGLLFATTRGRMRGILGPYAGYIQQAYLEWYETQKGRPSDDEGPHRFCWLGNVLELYAVRAPGNTCMDAIHDGCRGSIRALANGSKGCGGVMRVAPIGLYFGGRSMASLPVDLLGADAAALTHGHEMGYIPAAMLVHIVRLVSGSDEITLKQAVLDGKIAMEMLFPGAEHLPGFLKLIDTAISLSESDTDDLTAIHTLGPGWCGDEALAVAIYCALKYRDDFDRAIRAAVNHGGDSDSTGAITGNILGAYLGLSQIPQKYIDDLELADVIMEIADDLYEGCQIDAYSDFNVRKNKEWLNKYEEAAYKGCK